MADIRKMLYAEKFATDAGFLFSIHKEDKELLKILEPVKEIHREYITDNVTVIYTYRQEEQKVDRFRDADGINFYSRNPFTGETIFSICISVSALNAGKDYAALVFMHELAHVLIRSEKHTTTFTKILDSLIDQYNQATGSAIINDYAAAGGELPESREKVVNNAIDQEKHKIPFPAVL